MLDQLKRRGRALANRCFLCEEEEETIDYLLLHCPSVEMFWELFLAIVGQVGSSHSRFEKLVSLGKVHWWVRNTKRCGW